MTRLVSQLLTLARLDPKTALEGEQIDFVAVTREQVAEIAAAADGKRCGHQLASARRCDRTR